MKVLITGASGNLGSHLKSECERKGYEYEAVTRANINHLDRLIPGCDVVIHAAGDITYRITNKLVEVSQSNLMLTALVLEACVRHKVERFFYISSCAVYGNASSSHELGECQPISLNGKFKKLNEELVAVYCAEHGISATSFRLFNIYGGSDRFSILSHLKRCFMSGERFKLLNNGLSRRDFIHVQDAAELICKCLTLAELPTVLNVGTGDTTSVKDITEAFCKMFSALEFEHQSVQEVEYSRADTTLLKQTVGDYQFRKVLDDVAKLEI
ncbi:SDR family oxidoreductase [Alphaproteobacteria bacterium]|nr:SDR family oxidoreductase [Alphaproteobacteria bacterium]MDC1157089.1 SDR family oxidoreductase [Alphaproteobacteria bacterium]